jgi:hypothetical protein
MLNLIFIFMLSGAARLLYGEGSLASFRGYCGPKYKFEVPPNNAKFSKIIAIFRHGDRAPLSTKNSNWARNKCLFCQSNACYIKECQDGLLSIKGYEQAKNLGTFIKNYYYSYLPKPNRIDASHTRINRTLSTLKGVLEGMGEENVALTTDHNLMSESYCAEAKDSILNIRNLNNPMYKDAYSIYDKYMTSVCTDVSLNCRSTNCDVRSIKQFLETENSKFKKITDKTRRNITANAIGFSTIAKLIKSKLENNDTISLMSAHDSTLSRVLSGLNIDYSNIPPYASAIFIEVLREDNGQEKIRVSYEGEARKFGLYNESQINKPEFIKYLEMFANKENDIKNICKVDSQVKLTENMIEKQKESLQNLFKPLIDDVNAKINRISSDKANLGTNIPISFPSIKNNLPQMNNLILRKSALRNFSSLVETEEDKKDNNKDKKEETKKGTKKDKKEETKTNKKDKKENKKGDNKENQKQPKKDNKDSKKESEKEHKKESKSKSKDKKRNKAKETDEEAEDDCRKCKDSKDSVCERSDTCDQASDKVVEESCRGTNILEPKIKPCKYEAKSVCELNQGKADCNADTSRSDDCKESSKNKNYECECSIEKSKESDCESEESEIESEQPTCEKTPLPCESKKTSFKSPKKEIEILQPKKCKAKTIKEPCESSVNEYYAIETPAPKACDIKPVAKLSPEITAAPPTLPAPKPCDYKPALAPSDNFFSTADTKTSCPIPGVKILQSHRGINMNG